MTTDDESQRREYTVGDVVNGHMWDGSQWVPAAGQGQAAGASSSSPLRLALIVGAGIIGLIIVVVALGGILGQKEKKSGRYQQYYSYFVSTLRSGTFADFATAEGVSYETFCERLFRQDNVMGNVPESHEDDYVTACIDAHNTVFR